MYCIVIASYHFSLRIYSISFNFLPSDATRSILIHLPWGFCLRVEWWIGHHKHPSGHGAVRREWLASTDEFFDAWRVSLILGQAKLMWNTAGKLRPLPSTRVRLEARGRSIGCYGLISHSKWAKLQAWKRCMQCRGLQVFGPQKEDAPRKLFVWSIHWSINSSIERICWRWWRPKLRLGQTAEGNFLELVGAPSDFKDRSSVRGSEHFNT